MASQSLKRMAATRESLGDKLTIIPLGAGSEVGRSCLYLSFKGKTVLVPILLLNFLVCFSLLISYKLFFVAV